MPPAEAVAFPIAAKRPGGYYAAMGNRWLILPVLTMLLAGCPPPSPQVGGTPGPEERNRLLQVQVNAAAERIAELQARCDKLDLEIGRLNALNRQLQEQLKVVGDAPRQRDMYKRQVQDLTAEVERLRTRLQLAGMSIRPDAATRPASTSASLPATRTILEAP